MNKSQQGVALYVALIILLVVSMMGVAAMRSGILSERMSFNTQAREMSFQAAETAINGVIANARESGALLNDLVGSLATRTHCVSSDDKLVDGACGENDTFDKRNVMQAEAESAYDRQRVAFGNDAAAIVDYQFHTIGKGKFTDSADMPFVNRNRQEWRKLGPVGGPFEVSNPELIGLNTAAQGQ